MTASMMIVDAHQHVWNLDRADYPWLAPGMSPLERTYSLAEVAEEMSDCGVQRTILVQAADNDEDTNNMFDVADAHPIVAGIVAWVPLDRPEEAVQALDRRCLDKRMVGVRHLVHREPDPDWLLRPNVADSLAELARRGLVFEVCAESLELLAHLPALAEAHPTLRLVVDHLAKPPIRDRGWQPWADRFAAAAEAPNVFAKISGLNTAADVEQWTSEDFRPYVDHAITVFGADRLMCGSDWPFALTAARSYRHVWNGVVDALASLDDRDRAAVLGQTAVSCYRLQL